MKIINGTYYLPSMPSPGHMFSAIFMGFFFVAPLMPDEYTFSEEELAELMAETVHCTLEAGRSIPPADLQTVSHSFRQYVHQAVATSQEQVRKKKTTSKHSLKLFKSHPWMLGGRFLFTRDLFMPNICLGS